MKWLGIGLVGFIAVWYIAVCFASASYDEKGDRVSGWRRWARFLLLFPWLFVSTL
jgi:hypothetical protein